LAIVSVVAPAAAARAQDPDQATYTARDPQVDALLEQAAAKERQGDYGEAVRKYLELEALLERMRQAGAWPVTEVGPGLDAGATVHLRERIAALPPDGQRQWLASIDPRAREALAAARAGGPEAIEAVLARYPLASVVDGALAELAELAFERGELTRARRTLERIEARAQDPAIKRRAALLRLHAARAQGDPLGARAALDAFVRHGGDAAQRRAFGGREVTPRALADEAGAAAGLQRRPNASAGFDPGALARTLPLASPDAPDALARRLDRPPAHQEAVLDPDRPLLLVADGKTVRALPWTTGFDAPQGWTFTVQDEGSAPSRIEAAVFRPAIGPGRVFATLHRNRPALVSDDPENPDKQKVERRADWRVVALDRASGRLVWDAASADAFEQVARDAEWVSSPLYLDGGVFVTVLERSSDLRASLLRLDESTGALTYRTFLASRAAYDHLGLGSPPPPPAATPRGDVVVATGLGAIACVEPTRGEPVWLSRYPIVPEATEAARVTEGARARATAPLVAADPIVVAPIDGVEVLALDAATGRTVWRAPRGQARQCVEGVTGGEVLLLGRRLVAIDRATGRTRVVGPDLGAEAIAPPAVLKDELLVTGASELLRISLADGALLARLRLDAPRVEAGAATLVAPDLLATVSPTHVSLWSPLQASVKEIERRQGAGPRADLLLGALRARRGEVDQALGHLERAARKGGLDETSRLQARQLAFDLLAARALEARDRGDQAAFLAGAARALTFTWGYDPQNAAEARDPQSREEQALATAAADLLRAYGDALAAGDDPAGWSAAARAYQGLVRLPPATLTALPTGVRVSARAYGARRVRQLVKARGREVYAEQDKLAEEAYRLARASDQPEGLARVCERYPASARDADARWYLAQALEERGLRSEAARELERLVADHPADARRPDALARLARTYEKLRLLARARRALETLAALEPEPRVQGDDGAPTPARAWVAMTDARLGGGDPLALARARGSAGLLPPLRRAFRSTTELSQDGAALVGPGQAGTGPDEVIVLRRSVARAGGAAGATQDLLEVRRADDGAPVAVVAGVPETGGSRLDPILAAGHLVVPFEDRLEGWALSGPAAGQRAWTRSIEAGQGVVVTGPLPVHEVRGAGDGVAVLTGRNDLLLIDAATGAVRWRRTLPRRALGGLQARQGLVLALSSTPATIDAFRATDGAPTWTVEPAPEEGATTRLSSPCWLGATTLLYVQDGLRLVALDVTTGKRRYTITAEAAWIIGLVAAPDGGAFAARTQGADGQGLRVYEAITGQELWRDNGYGAIRPGQKPAAEGARPSIDTVVIGEDALYSFRTISGRTELWAQDVRLGKLGWSWQSPRGSTGTPVLVETPTAVIVPRHGGFGQRVTVNVLARGTGAVMETHQVPGRRLLGDGAQARAGVLVLATDRGVFGFAALDQAALAEETIDVALTLEAAPDDAQARSRLAGLLELGGRQQDAIDLLRGGILAEGVRVAAFDRLFGSLAALAESASEEAPLALDVQRMPRPPEIDGELSDWWRPWSSVTLAGPRHVQPIQAPPTVSPGRWTGDEDLSAELYMGWDERSFYFALDVSDTNLRPYDSEDERWIGDCLLIAIDTLGNGGDVVLGDDVLLSLALTLPKKKDNEEEEEEEEEQAADEDQKPEGTYFVRRKDDGSGAIYEAAIPWAIFAKHGVDLDPQAGPPTGFSFGFNIVLTDDDGDRADTEGGVRGAVKTLQITPSVLLHEEKSRLWQGYIPGRFAKITVR
jgi:outer membrane protein assembly factor BamB/TolA-binding protein